MIRIAFTVLLVLILTVSSAAAVAPLRLATTTTVASRSMDYLLPKFSDATGIAVQVTALGTGQALFEPALKPASWRAANLKQRFFAPPPVAVFSG